MEGVVEGGVTGLIPLIIKYKHRITPVARPAAGVFKTLLFHCMAKSEHFSLGWTFENHHVYDY